MRACRRVAERAGGNQDDGPAVKGWLAQAPIGVPPSRNSTDSDGSAASASAGVTVAVKVTLAPAVGAELETVSVVVVESALVVRLTGALVESWKLEPSAGSNTADTASGDAAVKAVRQVAEPSNANGRLEQPAIAVPLLSNSTVPSGIPERANTLMPESADTLMPEPADTLAVKVTA